MKSRFGHIQYISPGVRRVFWRENGKTRSKTIHGDDDAAELFLAHLRLGDETFDVTNWADYYKQSVVPTYEGLADKTIADYERLWKVELSPRIGSKMVSTTDWRFVEKTLNEIKSPSVQAHTFRLWRKMCNLAVRDGLLDRNPCDRSIRLKKQVKRKKQMLDASEVLPLIDKTHGTSYERLLLMEMCAGMRHGEAMAISLEDITHDGNRAILSVSEAVVVVNGRLIRKETKTAFSEREVVLSGALAERLLNASWPTRQQNPETVTSNWRDWCKRNEVPYVRFSDMRSVFATLACEVCDSSLVSMMMGHSDGTTRGRNYQQATRKALCIVSDAFEELITA